MFGLAGDGEIDRLALADGLTLAECEWDGDRLRLNELDGLWLRESDADGL
jgi:hypothetical protein